jgi:predicted aspartyl protease
MFKKIINKIFGKGSVEAMSFKQGFDLTELPIITLYQGEHKLNLLLDTGSNNNIIDSKIVESLEYTPIDTETNVYGLDGIKKKSSMCNLSLFYKDKEYNHEFVIRDMSAVFGSIKESTGVTLHGLIGSLFFNKYKYVLDFDELIAYSKG